MYEAYYGLRERPFDLTPNPRFLLRTPQHREALCTIAYGISSAKSICLVAGEAGTGKTTVVRTALASLPAGSRVAVMTNPTLTREEFVKYTAWKLGLDPSAGASKVDFLMALAGVLQVQRSERTPVALVVDEAHTLSDDLLEEVRLLANHQEDDVNLITVVLCGQPEIVERLNSNALRQLKQRVALRCTLRPFTVDETAAYIAGRIRLAGGQTAQVFSREAVTVIHEASRGIARTISVICDLDLEPASIATPVAQAKPLAALAANPAARTPEERVAAWRPTIFAHWIKRRLSSASVL
jgi:general secretion pathway protein A